MKKKFGYLLAVALLGAVSISTMLAGGGKMAIGPILEVSGD